MFQTGYVVQLEIETVPVWSVVLSVRHDILLDICHKDGCKDSGREEDSFCRCNGAVREDAWRTV